ncbi:MAG: hypothetical protein ACXWMK_08915 [Syntrophales bacterium]
MDRELEEAKRLARRIARSTGTPAFYTKKRKEVEASRRLFRSSPLIRQCLDLVKEREGGIGHGIGHSRKVAIDAGAISLVEYAPFRQQPEVRRIVLLSHVAGVLHDIRRLEKDHARASAGEAGMVLTRFDLADREVLAVTGAIRNHEAFREAEILEDPLAQFLSDALYDADKFRWGPDNFTEMLWDMVEYRKASLDALLKRFLRGMEGIKRIRETFRTHTGRIYGPDFIDRGIEIGMKFYADILQSKS